MTPEQTKNQSAPVGETATPGAERQRSTIEFPYASLEDGLVVARAIHERGVLSCTPDQLAGWMGQSGVSGAFRLRLSTARIFGLIETERGAITLTDIGRRIVDPAQERAARADAFLQVPLYRKLYDNYKGHTLPPRPRGLEHAMAQLGVSSKQTDRARQAFERSAQQAGFFAAGSERLIMPALPGRASEAIEAPRNDKPKTDDAKPSENGGRGGGNLPPLHPFIVGLLQTLPEPQSEWPTPERVKWLETAASIFGLIYKGEGIIKVTADK
jgi:hypothetical protein